VLCNAAEETVHHLFMGCVVANIIWSIVLNWVNFHQVVSITDQQLREWWWQGRAIIGRAGTGGFNSLVILTSWTI
jgi:hypothetical protein